MQEVFQKIANAVASRLPRYHVQLESIPDSPNSRMVAVYGVSDDDVPTVRRMIKDLDWEECQPSGLVALARIVTAATTREYYPDLAARTKQVEIDIEALLRSILVPRTRGISKWPPLDTQIYVECAGDLALAA